MSSSNIATHDAPAWQNESDFLIFVDLSQWAIADGWEQLWAKHLSDEFVVCCIPFFTYGIALGDRVCVAPSKGRDFVVTGVRARSGHRVARLWLKEAAPGGRDEVEAFVRRHSILHEHSSANLMAIDIPSDDTIAAPWCVHLERLAKDYSISLEYGD